MNWIQKLRERRTNRRKQRELAALAQQHKTLIRLQEAGLIVWNQKTRQLFIAEPLALLMMQTAEKWTAFIQNLYAYEQYRLSSKAWEDYMQREELAAVRAAIKHQELAGEPPLSEADIHRIRRARRQEIAQTDMQPPRLEGFEFFICRDTTDAQPQVVAVGHYDADTEQMEMATWQEVQRLMEQAKAEKKK